MKKIGDSDYAIILLTESICHIFAYMCSYLTVPEKEFFSKMKNGLNDKIPNMGNYNDNIMNCLKIILIMKNKSNLENYLIFIVQMIP
jgi:hypothetical protein